MARKDQARPLSFCVKGREAICEAVGENWKNFRRLVEAEGLPAFRSRPTGIWKAMPADLHAWLKAQRDRCLGERRGEAEG